MLAVPCHDPEAGATLGNPGTLHPCSHASSVDLQEPDPMPAGWGSNSAHPYPLWSLPQTQLWLPGVTDSRTLKPERPYGERR